HFRFVLIGNGPLKNDIQSYLESKNLTDKICIAGYLDKAYEYIADMDVFLLVSKREGLGTSILDSFASETPVIGTKTGGIPELVLHQKTGLIIPVSNPEELANAIEKLMSEKELRQSFIKVARDYVNEFSKEVKTSKTIDVYHQTLNT
ncbi:MAG: glycosyltransferase, partial [Cyclobacteriaceae bacterium]|nr:glycosyltransferase [Cyclobacteriaceae bacterium]